MTKTKTTLVLIIALALTSCVSRYELNIPEYDMTKLRALSKEQLIEEYDVTRKIHKGKEMRIIESHEAQEQYKKVMREKGITNKELLARKKRPIYDISRVRIGMTRAKLIEAVGIPRSINTTTTGRGSMQQYIYRRAYI